MEQYLSTYSRCHRTQTLSGNSLTFLAVPRFNRGSSWQHPHLLPVVYRPQYCGWDVNYIDLEYLHDLSVCCLYASALGRAGVGGPASSYHYLQSNILFAWFTLGSVDGSSKTLAVLRLATEEPSSTKGNILLSAY